MLRILIAEDHPALRRAIRSVIESHAGWQVVGEAEDGGRAVELAEQTNPDVIVMDLAMPRVSGLEAMRTILGRVTGTQVLILTAHESPELWREAIRKGAGGVIAKSVIDERLIPTIESFVQRREGMHLAGSRIRENHTALFARSKAEAYAILAPFILEGLRQGQKVVHLIDPDDREQIMGRLSSNGVDVLSAERNRQLELVAWSSLYGAGGFIEPAAVFGFWERALRDSAGDGYGRARIIGNMDWALHIRAGTTELPTFEFEIDRFFQNFPDCETCVYDLSKFDERTINKVSSAHPAVVLNGELQANAAYDRWI